MEKFEFFIKEIQSWVWDFSKFYKNLELNTQPIILFISLAVIFLILYGLSLGRTKALISILSIYVALAFDATFPYLTQLYEMIGLKKDTYIIRMILFLLIYLIVFIILSNSFAAKRFVLKDASIISVFIISLSQIGLLMAVIFNQIPKEIMTKMPEYLLAYFATNKALFFWIIIPIILLIFLPKSKRKNTVN
jgi:hypothetical protein